MPRNPQGNTVITALPDVGLVPQDEVKKIKALLQGGVWNPNWLMELSLKKQCGFPLRVLILSDGLGMDGLQSGLEELAESKPNLVGMVIGSDYKAGLNALEDDNDKAKKFERLGGIDNRAPLPFRDGSFDLILMMNGLCYCEVIKGSACCGVSYSNESDYSFLREVVRVLDRPGIAYLSGNNAKKGMASPYEGYWKAAAVKVMGNEAQVQIDMAKTFSVFEGLKIKKYLDQ